MKQLVVTIQSPAKTEYSVMIEVADGITEEEVQAHVNQLHNDMSAEGMNRWRIVKTEIVEDTERSRE